MEYAILMYESATEFARRGSADHDAYMSAWDAYIGAVQAAGIQTGGAGLQGPGVATTVRLRGGQRSVQDGPYADSKEQLGGFLTIKTDTLDQALEWAARCPAATSGAVEIRPLLSM